MDLEQRLRASLVAPDPGAMFTARVMARVGRGAARRRGSIFLIGTVLVVGAAAAMLSWRKPGVQPPPVQSAVMPTVPDRETLMEDPLQAIPQAIEPAVPAAPPEPAFKDIPRYSVLVMPLPQQVQDVSQRVSLEALHAAMLDELRKVPGLTLRVSGAAEQGEGDQADYVLTLSSLATAVSQSGGVTFRSTEGGNTYTVNERGVDIDYGANVSGDVDAAAAAYGSRAMTGAVNLMLNNRTTSVDIDHGVQEAIDGGGVNFFTSARGSMSSVSADGGVVSFSSGGFSSPESVVWVEMKVQSRRSASFRYTFPAGVEGTAEPPSCNGPNAGLPPECMTSAQLAAYQVQMLRLQAFPPDAGFQQRVIARLGSASADGRKVLQDLLPLLTGDGGARLDAATIHALFQYVAGQPEGTRAEVWRTLFQVSHPALVAPLVDSLRRDANRQVRLAALANLEANYHADPLVRGAFEEIDRDDPDAVVRAAVRWALYGQTQWRSDVLAAIHDTNLPYQARLAPLIARTAADVSPQQSFQMTRIRQAVLQEQQVLQPLMSLLREHLRDADHAQATGDVLRMLGNVDDPAVFDLFLEVMRETSLPIQISGAVGTWAINHRNDPRVRESFPLVEPSIPSGLLERMRQIGE